MSTWLEDILAETKQQITLYIDAIDALVVGGIESYTIDTGQTRQTVTKLDLEKLQKQLDTLINRADVLESRLSNGGAVTMGAAW